MRIRPRDVLLLAITRPSFRIDIDGPIAGRQSQKGLAPSVVLRVSHMKFVSLVDSSIFLFLLNMPEESGKSIGSF